MTSFPYKIFEILLNGGTQINEPKEESWWLCTRPLHLRDYIDWLCVSRKERGREIASTEDYVDTSTQGIEGDIKKSKKY